MKLNIIRIPKVYTFFSLTVLLSHDDRAANCNFVHSSLVFFMNVFATSPYSKAFKFL